MIQALHLRRFKNFKDADLKIGPLTLLIGSNASGKSNLGDAFRFLHGVSLGYQLADIFGEKYVGGILRWSGIRGGTREVTYPQSSTFELEIELEIDGNRYAYLIGIEPVDVSGRPSLSRESLNFDKELVFDAPSQRMISESGRVPVLSATLNQGGSRNEIFSLRFTGLYPILTQINIPSLRTFYIPDIVESVVKQTVGALQGIGFIQFDPAAMRIPSVPGQITLGERGENLSSVLQAICEDSSRKQALVEWVCELTPMDAADFEFPADHTGKVLVTLVEKSEQRVSAYNASDGTLRFLGFLAALLGPEPAGFYFIEEVENGIHPARLHLLLQFLERETARRKIQVIATTHSPQVLRYLSSKSLHDTSLVYRLSGSPEARIIRLGDLPREAQQVMRKKDAAGLFESGWFEDIVDFMDEEPGT